MSFSLSSVDDEELVHEAVRQGHRFSLEIYLNQNPQCINRIYVHQQCLWTPLLAACYYKHISIVQMLIKQFSVNIEATGTIVFDLPANNPEKVEEVSALWTAAASDSMEIVRLLVEQGKANVNHLTKTHSTALRVACYNNNLEMVKYFIQHGANPFQGKIGNYTNLMLTAGRGYLQLVEYLIDQTHCDVNERDENGQGALYYGVKSGSIEIVKYLLKNGAKNVRDSLRNVTPLMRAALYGKIDLFDVFQGFCSDIEWIEGKELLGATFAGWIAPIEDLEKTKKYLCEAFRSREEKNLPKILPDEPLEIFNNRFECLTFEEFQQMITSNNIDALRIESIRIHHRLLGDRSNDYHYVLRFYGAFLADDYRFVECCLWWLYEFELKEKYRLYIDHEQLRWLLNIFMEMKRSQSKNVSLDILYRTLKLVHHEMKTIEKLSVAEYNLHTLLYLITIIAQTFESLDLQIEDPQMIYRDRIEELIEKILQHRFSSRTSGRSLLHLSCNFSPFELSTFSGNEYPCATTVRLLVKCGANIDDLDRQKNTPLHVLLENPEKKDEVSAIIDVFSSHHVHSDRINVDGKTPQDLIPGQHQQLIRYLRTKIGAGRLKCLCANAIIREKLFYDNSLSNSLILFIKQHSANH